MRPIEVGDWVYIHLQQDYGKVTEIGGVNGVRHYMIMFDTHGPLGMWPMGWRKEEEIELISNEFELLMLGLV